MHGMQPTLGLNDSQRRTRWRHLLQGGLQRKVRNEGIRIWTGCRNFDVGKLTLQVTSTTRLDFCVIIGLFFRGFGIICLLKATLLASLQNLSQICLNHFTCNFVWQHRT